MYTVCDQMKWLVHKLAWCLCVNVPSTDKSDISAAWDFQQDAKEPQEDMAEGTTDKLLMEMREIRKLMLTQIRNRASESKKPDVDVESRNDWKLAAAVFDRFLSISFCIIFIAGTVIFFSVFTIHYHPNN